ncbi:hypothetical protein [Actinocorallia herbida]|uniref:hypothetical protein n=1 Tax=Actinocorallia herbida TaxID=58109 RepID=UPI000F4B33AA|nr:hypothetical protein [Actinocorallia herbida]
MRGRAGSCSSPWSAWCSSPSGGDGEEADTAVRRKRDDAALRLALVSCERATVLRLRDDREIDDTVLRQIRAILDIEEVRLNRNPISE